MNKEKHNLLSYLAVAGGTLLFYMVVLPVADSLSNLIQQSISNKIAKMQYTFAQDQQETEEIADRINGNCSVQAVGFQVANESEEDYEN